MQLPPYFLPRPALDTSAATLADFARLYAEAVLPGTGQPIDYTLDVPKWQFLCWLTEAHDVVLHGSGDPDIREFEPRQSNDTDEFGNRKAVYAASDGIWAMYFAIVDRGRRVQSLVNSCFRVVAADGACSEPYYYFSVDADALPHAPWRSGAIYILPRAGFEQQPREGYRGLEVEHAQWASATPVPPLASLAVTQADFPLREQVRGHDIREVYARAEREPEGFPWVDECSELTARSP